MHLTVYGIPNCDSTKKAILWLNKNKIGFSFFNYKLQKISHQKLQGWCAVKGWETIFNKRSSTWRELSEEQQKIVTNKNAAIKIMLTNNSIIKRPIIEQDQKIFVGFNENEYKGLINK